MLDVSHMTCQQAVYLHGEGGGLLVVVVQDVGHEGGVVRQPLTHAQRHGLAGEQTVAPGRSVHGNGYTCSQHGHGKSPEEIHDRSVLTSQTQETAG